MEPINVWIVLGFQAAWLAIVIALIIHIFKLYAIIAEMRSTLAPFARDYEEKEFDLTTVQSLKNAHRVYMRVR
jgi:hypothetical protein